MSFDTHSPAAPTHAPVTEHAPLGGVLQRMGGEAGGGSNQAIAASGFAGSTMPLPYRSEMESGFGMSFSGVSVYGGGAAAEANSALGSQAYAVGQNIAFASSNPAPEIVAHELAHTIQQGDAGPVQTWSEGTPGDAFEQEADAAAATVMDGGVATVSRRTGPAIARWGGSDHYTIGNLAGSKALGRFRAQFPSGDPMTPQVDPTRLANGLQQQAGAAGNDTANVGTTPESMAARDAASRAAGPGLARVEGSQRVGGRTPDGAPPALGVQTNEGVISFGAASRYGGDYDTTVGKLANRTEDVATGMLENAQMIIGGTTNSNHFYPVNGGEYLNHHQLALGHARKAYQLAQDPATAPQAQAEMAAAMQEEGFGNHFLQDTFASGHMVPRSLDSVESLASQPVNVVAQALSNAGNRVESAVTSGAESVGSGVGRVVGAVGGAVGGFFSAAWNWRNPFSGAAEGAQQGAESGAQTGASVGNTVGSAVGGAISTATGAAARGVDAVTGEANAAAQGLLRAKQWHDFFCALPEGLPTSRGRFHGDYYMDGTDLDIVSNTCADSIMEVLSAGQGAPQSHGMAAQIPRPDFAGIMADPVAGPVWRMMMRDYQADLERARARVQAGDEHTTDGGTTMSSRAIVDQIYANTFGGDAGVAQADRQPGTAGAMIGTVAAASVDPVGTLNDKRTQLKGCVDVIAHYIQTHFGYNANLGNVNDDMAMESLEVGASATDFADVHGFDAVQLEGTYSLYTNLAGAAMEYTLVGEAVLSGSNILPGEQLERLRGEVALATGLKTAAQQWAAAARAAVGRFSFDDAIGYRNHGNTHGEAGRQLRIAVYDGICGGGGSGGASGVLGSGGGFSATAAVSGN